MGLKPTYGRVIRWGVIAYASSLDQAGPMTRTVRDTAIMLGAMASADPHDSTCADLPVPDFEAALDRRHPWQAHRIPREYRVDGMPDAIDALWRQGAEMLRDAGAEIVDISLPHTKYALPAYYVIAPAEASSNLARYDGVRYGQPRDPGQGRRHHREMYENSPRPGLRPRGPAPGDDRHLCAVGGFYDAYYNRARRVRALIKRDFDQAFAAASIRSWRPRRPRRPSARVLATRAIRADVSERRLHV